MDPDEVFWKCSFETVIAFAVEQKERQEFRERYNEIYKMLNDSTGSDTRSKHGSGD